MLKPVRYAGQKKDPIMYQIGRFLQLVGLGLTGLGCLIAFDQSTSESTMWVFALLGLGIFALGHFITPKN